MKRLSRIIVIISTIVLISTGCYNKVSNIDEKAEVIIQPNTTKNEEENISNKKENSTKETEVIKEEIKTKLNIVNYQIFFGQNNSVFEFYEHDKLYNPAYLDNIEICFEDYIEDNLLVSAITNYNLEFNIIHDANKTILQLQNLNNEMESIHIQKEFAKYNNQILLNDINISFNGDKPEFKLFRLDNYTQKFQSNYPHLTTSDVIVEIDFEQEMDKSSVEAMLTNNVLANDNTSIPQIDYNWNNNRNLIVSLSELKVGDRVKIDLTGARDIDNNIILGLYDSNKSDIGGMFNTENIIYEFSVSDYDYLGVYSYDDKKVNILHELSDESYWVGNISDDNSWVMLGMADEWAFHMSIFDILTRKNYFVGDQISVGSIEDTYIDDKYGVFCTRSKLEYIDLNSLDNDNIVINEATLLEGASYEVIAFDKSPNNNYSCLVKGEENITLIIIDTMMNPIDSFNIPIDINSRIYGNFYWFNDNIIGFSTEDSQEKITSYIINIRSGEIVERYQNKRIVSFNSEYKKVIMYDLELEQFSIYNTKLDLINNFKLPQELYYYPYSDLVIWNNSNEFLVIPNGKHIVKFNIDSKLTSVYNTEEQNFAIIKGLRNNQLLIITNTQRMHSEMPLKW